MNKYSPIDNSGLINKDLKNYGDAPESKGWLTSTAAKVFGAGIVGGLALGLGAAGVHLNNDVYNNDAVFDTGIDGYVIVADINEGARSLSGSEDSKFSNIRLEAVDPDKYSECAESSSCKDMIKYVQQANWNVDNIDQSLGEIRSSIKEANSVAMNSNRGDFCGSQYRDDNDSAYGNNSIEKMLVQLDNQVSEISLQKDVPNLLSVSLGLMADHGIDQQAIANFKAETTGQTEWSTSFDLKQTCGY